VEFTMSLGESGFIRFVKIKKGGKLLKMENGIIYLKGGDFREEIKSFSDKIQIIELNTYFEEEFFETKKLIYLAVSSQKKKSK